MATAFHSRHPIYRVRETSPEELPWMLRRNIWTGVLGHTAVVYLTSGVFFTAFGQEMGMRHEHFGVLAALQAFTMLAMLFAPAIQERFRQRKYPWFILSLASRLALAPLLLGLFVRVSPWVIMALVATYAAFGNMAHPLWQSWVWDYVPAGTLARFWARRTFWITLAGTAFALCAAGAVRSAGPEARLRVVVLVFCVLLAAAMVDLFYHRTIPEPPRRAPPARSLAKLREAFANPYFRNWLLLIAIWHFALAISGPFCVPYMMKDLGFKDQFFAATVLIVAVPAAGSLLALHFWGRALDTRHPGKIVTTCFAFWSVIPLFYYFSTPDNALWTLAPAWGIAGVFPAGVRVAMPLLTSRLSGQDKTMPVALMWMVLSMGLVIGSTLGACIVASYGVQRTFFVSFAARSVAALLAFLLLVHRPRSDRAGQGDLLGRPPDKAH